MSITAQEQDRMAARLGEIRPFLDERAWRLLLRAEARAIGYGGMKIVAAASKAKADTVSRVAHELESGIVPDGRVRAVGAGRPAAAVADPGLAPALRSWSLRRPAGTRNRRCGGRRSRRRVWPMN
jgi:hypothetical protein